MNERIIQKLMNQSYVDIDQYNNRFSPEKFAEKIIRECIQAVYDDGQDAEYYRDRIRHHFGVEE